MKPNSLSVLIGAGFSKWAAGLPVANELFDSPITPFGKRDSEKAEIVHLAREAWAAKHPHATAEQFIAYALAQSENLRSAVIWYIVRRLSEPYIWQEWHAGRWRRHVLMIDEYRKFERPGVPLAQEFFTRLRPALSGIITPNYDLLVEYALGTKLFNYGRENEYLSGRGAFPVSQWNNPVILRGPIAVAKVHGSISWDTKGKHTDGRGGITGKALIVAPTPEKRPPPELAFEWDLARAILNSATTLLVFGFSFNPYDEALLELLRQDGQSIKEAILVDKSPRADRATALWPNATLRVIPPPSENEKLAVWCAGVTRP